MTDAKVTLAEACAEKWAEELPDGKWRIEVGNGVAGDRYWSSASRQWCTLDGPGLGLLLARRVSPMPEPKFGVGWKVCPTKHPGTSGDVERFRWEETHRRFAYEVRFNCSTVVEYWEEDLSPAPRPEPKFKVGDAVIVDGHRCRVVGRSWSCMCKDTWAYGLDNGFSALEIALSPAPAKVKVKGKVIQDCLVFWRPVCVKGYWSWKQQINKFGLRPAYCCRNGDEVEVEVEDVAPEIKEQGNG